jgi:hypothetical protein
MTFVKPIIKSEQHFVVNKPVVKTEKPTRPYNTSYQKDKFLLDMY